MTNPVFSLGIYRLDSDPVSFERGRHSPNQFGTDTGFHIFDGDCNICSDTHKVWILDSYPKRCMAPSGQHTHGDGCHQISCPHCVKVY